MVFTAPLHINIHLNTTPGQHKTEGLFLTLSKWESLQLKGEKKKTEVATD